MNESNNLSNNFKTKVKKFMLLVLFIYCNKIWEKGINISQSLKKNE